MRQALWCLVLVAACHTAPAGNVLTGAESPRSAVERFLAAARAQDMQALSVMWGNDRGPQRDQLERQELEKRELIMIALLRHDQSKISEPKRIDGGKRLARFYCCWNCGWKPAANKLIVPAVDPKRRTTA